MVIAKEFYTHNRLEFGKRLPDNIAVCIFAGEEKPMCQDTDYRFLPDRNFFYLTGLDVPGFILLITKENNVILEKLFILPPDSLKERWTGKRLKANEVSKISGIDESDVLFVEDFNEQIFSIAKKPHMSLALDGSSIMSGPRELRNSLSSVTNHFYDVKDILIDMRMVKSEEEIEAIKEATRITEEALEDIKPLIKPGVSEYEIYAALEYGMAKRGSLIPAFTTIVSCGVNTFYLHHGNPETDGDGIAKEGSMIQIDVGARSAGYCGDISRVYFVGGDKGDRRAKLLELIKTLRQKAWSFIAPGETFKSLNEAMYDITGNWLFENGLVPENYTIEDIRKYYWHNTSHHLGLDVHDVSVKDKPFVKGNCLAVEPGVYIPEWEIGFRIEDDVVVTEDGCMLLSSGRDDIEGIYC